MRVDSAEPRGAEPSQALDTLRKVLTVLFLLFVFLMGVKGLGGGFKLLGHDLLEAFFSATENPFIGLMIGILSTTLVQSSSVSTSMIVGLVAAPENPLPVANAVPMIMGTNIGTTVTNTIVALGHLGRKEEFRRAFAVATCHDFFNFITVAVLLVVELTTGYLHHAASWITSSIGGVSGVEYESPFDSVLKVGLGPIESLSQWAFESPQAQGLLMIGFSAVFIFGALVLLVRTMRTAMQTRVEASLNRLLGRSAAFSFVLGIVVTVMVQSSSITTSLLVPLAGAGLITLPQAFPVTLGANIGTTVTALLASMAVSGANAQAGVTIALVHFLFNITGTLMIYPVKAVRAIPLKLAQGLADIAVNSRQWALLYVIVLFYGLPALFAFADRLFG
ncbi:MAG: Na/Pi symporter [Bryobacterales bacterium]